MRFGQIKSAKLRQKIIQSLKNNAAEAKVLLKDPVKTYATLRKAREKAGKIDLESFKALAKDFFVMLEMAKAYVRRDYRQVPVRTILAIIGAAIYVINPIDIIPDFIPGIGYLDDAFVIGMVLKQIRTDLQRFKDWQVDGEVELVDDDYEILEDEDVIWLE